MNRIILFLETKPPLFELVHEVADVLYDARLVVCHRLGVCFKRVLRFSKTIYQNDKIKRLTNFVGEGLLYRTASYQIDLHIHIPPFYL